MTPDEVELLHNDLQEEWREYDFGLEGARRVYHISNPVELVTRPGGSTHRIIDNMGIVHIVPAVGVNGCVVRYQVAEDAKVVAF